MPIILMKVPLTVIGIMVGKPVKVGTIPHPMFGMMNFIFNLTIRILLIKSIYSLYKMII